MSQDFTQAKLKKLAEIAGRTGGEGGFYWKPHEDLNQAFECLANLDYWFRIVQFEHDEFVIDLGEEEHTIKGLSLAEAICKAVLEAKR